MRKRKSRKEEIPKSCRLRFVGGIWRMGYKSSMRFSASLSRDSKYLFSFSGRLSRETGSPSSLASFGAQRVKFASCQPVHHIMASVLIHSPVSRVTERPLAEIICARFTRMSFSSSTRRRVSRSLSCVIVPPGTNQNRLRYVSCDSFKLTWNMTALGISIKGRAISKFESKNRH